MTGPPSGQARSPLLPGILLVLGCLVYATWVRLEHVALWQAGADAYQVDGAPLLVTADSYYFLRWARAHLEGRYRPGATDPLRHYQRLRAAAGTERDWLPQQQPARLPLLSRLLAEVHRRAGVPLEWAALYLPAVLASLFMVPLFLYFWWLGLPAAGLAGGLLTTFSMSYFARSTAGWLDTDVLNLFFPWLAALLLLPIRRERPPLVNLALAAASGLLMYIFWLWYQHAALTLLYAVVLVLVALVQRLPLRLVLACLAAFLVSALPEQMLYAGRELADFAGHQLGFAAPWTLKSGAGLVFPDVSAGVAEARRLSFEGVLELAAGHYALGLAGLAGMVFMLSRYWQQAIPLLVLLGLAGLSFVSGQRFVMYLAPFVGAGLGYLFLALLDPVLLRLAPGLRERPAWRSWVTHGVLVVVFFGALYPWLPAREHLPRPFARAEVVDGYRDLARQAGTDSPLWTWWDMGYALEDMGFAVFHDGGAWHLPQTYLVARSLASPDPAALSNIVRFVEQRGMRGVERGITGSGTARGFLKRVEDYSAASPGTPVLVGLDHSMLAGFAEISRLGGWPFGAAGNAAGGYRFLDCEGLYGDRLACGAEEIDISLGVVDGETFLSQTLLLERGEVVHVIDYHRDSGPHLQIEIEDRQPGLVMLVDAGTFRSNFNQMFVLGRHDEERFEEVLFRYPHIRVFRLLPR